MKTTLTKDDPAGWYLCEFNGAERCFWWDGESMRRWPGDEYSTYMDYTNFRRLYTEADVAALNEELQSLRDQLTCCDHENSDLSCKVKSLESKLAALRKQPYAMRKAEKPDCVGVWTNGFGEWRVRTLDAPFPIETYYYLGPIPVFPVEQKPPQVVKVKHKETGEVCRAIPSPCGKWLGIIGDDGSYLGNESVDNWEAVQ